MLLFMEATLNYCLRRRLVNSNPLDFGMSNHYSLLLSVEFLPLASNATREGRALIFPLVVAGNLLGK
jgi:hypothetical protein